MTKDKHNKTEWLEAEVRHLKMKVKLLGEENAELKLTHAIEIFNLTQNHTLNDVLTKQEKVLFAMIKSPEITTKKISDTYAIKESTVRGSKARITRMEGSDIYQGILRKLIALFDPIEEADELKNELKRVTM